MGKLFVKQYNPWRQISSFKCNVRLNVHLRTKQTIIAVNSLNKYKPWFYWENEITAQGYRIVYAPWTWNCKMLTPISTVFIGFWRSNGAFQSSFRSWMLSSHRQIHFLVMSVSLSETNIKRSFWQVRIYSLGTPWLGALDIAVVAFLSSWDLICVTKWHMSNGGRFS